MGNPAVNGVILGILAAGIAYIFRQVLLLNPASDWIDSFRERLADRDLTAPPGPRRASWRRWRACSAAARAVGSACRRPRCRRCSTASPRRLDETRETSRYLIGVLVFLGLLGTFYGLLETVRSVGGVIGALNVGASDLTRAFADLKAGLESPLHGMSTAFSFVAVRVGRQPGARFLDLQAGQAQNRFYNDLEEWLSTYTRLFVGPVRRRQRRLDAGLSARPLGADRRQHGEFAAHHGARRREPHQYQQRGRRGLTDRLGVLGENLRAGRR